LPPEQELFAELFQAQAFFAKLLQSCLACRLGNATNRLAQRQTGSAGKFLQLFQALPADAARGQINHPPQANFIFGVVNQAQKSNHILHFAPPIETLRANQPVTDALPPKAFFQQARLGIGAIHHREGTGIKVARADAGFYRIHNKFRLFFVIRCRE